ncbi:helix-turn-helix domain-containing protein, partial [Streptacidiphilus anmyonensis]|uniref:helix-turn-helix domain-containing protein n=1 Tax=Streptacidiphilus anmyonensis TaxID=405782 RepID=UPI00191C19DF
MTTTESASAFATGEAARSAPDQHDGFSETVRRACRLMDRSAQPPSLNDLAAAAGYSQFHFHRMFKACTGITPHAYLAAVRARRVRRELARGAAVSDAIYSAGFNSNGHFYAASTEILGMTPKSFRAGGRGTTIRHATGRCSLGPALVATTDRGVCAVLIGDGERSLRSRLGGLFPRAEVTPPDLVFTAEVHDVLARAALPAPGRTLPADVRGVVLEQLV